MAFLLSIHETSFNKQTRPKKQNVKYIFVFFLTSDTILGGADSEKNADKNDKFLTKSHPSPVNYFLEKFVKKGVANFRT